VVVLEAVETDMGERRYQVDIGNVKTM